MPRGVYKRTPELRAKITKHGMASSPTYHVWATARQRCNSPSAASYRYYGGRGIEMRLTFEEFLEEVGVRPEGNFSIDRIDNDGHYERGNLRWATRSEQRNNRRTTVVRSPRVVVPRR